MINRRGAVWLFLHVVISCALGWHFGQRYEAQRWERWTYSHVAWDGKGDRK